MKKIDELVSIIIPVYNVEKYLERCINSVINQTYTNLEIIIIDDGSSDRCAEICDKYSDIDKRIKVIHKENGGLSDARNSGLDICKGDYIAFVDSDDWIENKMIENLHNLILKNNSDISVCNFVRTSKEVEIQNKKEKTIKYNSYDAIKELLKGKKIQDYVWNKLYRAELFNNIRFPKGKNMEDKGTTYKTFLKANSIVTTTNSYYYYFDRTDSIINKINYKLLSDEVDLSVERYKELKKIYPEMLEIEKYLYKYLINWYYTGLKNNDKKIQNLMKKNISILNKKFYFVDLKTMIKAFFIRKDIG